VCEFTLRGGFVESLVHLVFVDCEARGRSPVNGVLTEFGAVHYETGETFHGRLFEGTPDPANPAVPLVGPRIADDADVAAELRGWLTTTTPSTTRWATSRRSGASRKAIARRH
jgi:hypothetical protein